MVGVPNLGFAVGGGGEEEVAGAGEEAERGDGFGVRFPGMDEFLGDEVLGAAGVFAEVDVQILRNVHVRAAQVVELLCAVEFGGFDLGRVVLVVGGFFAHGRHGRWCQVFLFIDLNVFLIASKFAVLFGGLLFVNLLALIFRPWAEVGTFTFHDAGVALLLPFCAQRCRCLLGGFHLDDIAATELSCVVKITDKLTRETRVARVA